MRHYKPFLSTNSNTSLLVWARDKRHARRLLRDQWSEVPSNDWNIQVVAPDKIILPPEMMAMDSPPEMQGEVRTPTKRFATRENFLVPDFLKEKRRAVIYTRVSTSPQASNISLDSQRETCEAFAEVAGLNVTNVYVEVARGDHYLSRPKLQSALEDLEEGRAEVLLVAYFDRLVRDMAVQHLIFERIQNASASFISCDMQCLAGPEHELALRSQLIAHQFKRDCAREWGLLD